MDRQATRAQLVDPLGKDVADDDVVAAVREARAGDEADVAGAEDRDPGHRYFFFAFVFVFAFAVSSGWSPLAIAIIVSFESESTRVFTTQ